MNARRMPIEELSRRTGFSVRNIRELQARRLLPPPTLEGRLGFYGEAHEARLRLIQRMQRRGYTLASIGELLEGWQKQADVGQMLGLERAVSQPVLEPHRPLGQQELLAALPELEDATLRKRAIAAELVHETDGELCADSGELVEHVRVLVECGFPLAAVLAELEQLNERAHEIAERLRQITERHLVAPFREAGAPAEGIPALTDKLVRVRPIGARIFALLIARDIERGGGT